MTQIQLAAKAIFVKLFLELWIAGKLPKQIECQFHYGIGMLEFWDDFVLLAKAEDTQYCKVLCHMHRLVK